MLAVALTMVVMTVSGWMLLESHRGYPCASPSIP